MGKTIDRRLGEAEQRLKKRSTNMSVVRVEGGLPGPIRCASAEGFHWAWLPDEALDVFEQRAIAAATAVRAKTLMFGGLCGCAWNNHASFQAYLDGLSCCRFDGHRV
jgi:hypothetical protein